LSRPSCSRSGCTVLESSRPERGTGAGDFDGYRPIFASALRCRNSLSRISNIRVSPVKRHYSSAVLLCDFGVSHHDGAQRTGRISEHAKFLSKSLSSVVANLCGGRLAIAGFFNWGRMFGQLPSLLDWPDLAFVAFSNLTLFFQDWFLFVRFDN